jgi:hypothetical protein
MESGDARLIVIPEKFDFGRWSFFWAMLLQNMVTVMP